MKIFEAEKLHQPMIAAVSIIPIMPLQKRRTKQEVRLWLFQELPVWKQHLYSFIKKVQLHVKLQWISLSYNKVFLTGYKTLNLILTWLMCIHKHICLHKKTRSSMREPSVPYNYSWCLPQGWILHEIRWNEPVITFSHPMLHWVIHILCIHTYYIYLHSEW